VRIPAFILSLCLLAVAATADTTKQTDLSGFIGDIQDLTKRIEATEASGEGRAIASELPTAWHVRQGDDDYTVSSEWIAAPLRQAGTHPAEWPKTRATLIEHLTQMRDEAMSLQEGEEDSGKTEEGAVTTTTTHDPHAALKEVLALSEFKQREDSRWNDEIRRRISQWITDMLDRLPSTHGATAAVSMAFAWAASIWALIALVVYLWRARLPRRSITPLAIELPRPTSAEWAARAYAALRAGDAREAMHCGYHAVLFRLEEQGVWHVDDARTPREYVHLLPAHDARRAAFIDLTRRFEQTWYGSRAADGPGLIKNLEAFGCSAPSPSKPAI
jgi:hypothetical protein